jgi:hypothetical protein
VKIRAVPAAFLATKPSADFENSGPAAASKSSRTSPFKGLEIFARLSLRIPEEEWRIQAAHQRKYPALWAEWPAVWFAQAEA